MKNASFKLSNTTDARKYLTVAVVIAIIIVVIVVLNNVTGFINKLFGNTTDPNSIKANQDVLAADLAATNVNSPFNPSVFNNRPSTAAVLSDDMVASVAGNVYESVGSLAFLFGSAVIDAGQAFAAIKNCMTQVEISQVSIKFADAYSTDMYDYMSKWFHSDTNVQIFSQILSYVKGLPKY